MTCGLMQFVKRPMRAGSSASQAPKQLWDSEFGLASKIAMRLRRVAKPTADADANADADALGAVLKLANY